MDTAAPAPARSMNGITLQWGMVSMPLSIYKATEDVAVARKEFHGDNPVGRQYIDKVTEEVIEYAEITKKALASNGEWVELSDEEIAAATGNPERCEVLTFIPLGTIGTKYAVADYNYVRPKREKGKSLADEPFALLMEAMAERQVAALLRLTLRGPARFVALTPQGVLVYLRPVETLREAPAMPALSAEMRGKALPLAVNLIDALGIETPVLHDENPAKVQAFVDAKSSGAPAAPLEPAPIQAATNLLDSLMASVEQTKSDKKRRVRRKVA